MRHPEDARSQDPETPRELAQNALPYLILRENTLKTFIQGTPRVASDSEDLKCGRHGERKLLTVVSRMGGEDFKRI